MGSKWKTFDFVYSFISSMTEADDIEELEMSMNLSEGNITTTMPSPSSYDYIHPDDLKRVQVIFGMILIPLFSLFGSIGNILTLVVLFQHRMRNTTNFCLAALSVSDLLFLLHCLLFAGINIQIFTDPQNGQYVRTIMFPVFGAYSSLATARITSWLTLLLGIERFIAVYFPFKAKVICNKKFTVIAILSIFTTTLVLFLPYAFKYINKQVFNRKTNKTMTVLTLSNLGKEEYFFKVYGILMNAMFRFLPIVALIVINILIIRIMKKTWAKRKHISNADKHTTTKSREQTHITVMLLTVSFIFLFCLMPGALHNLASHIWVEYCRKGKASMLYECISYVTFFLETVNSSVNFVIYMVMSTKFCRTYKEIFCCRKFTAAYQSSLNSHSRDSSLSIYKQGQFRVMNSRRTSNNYNVTQNSGSNRKISSEARFSVGPWQDGRKISSESGFSVGPWQDGRKISLESHLSSKLGSEDLDGRLGQVELVKFQYKPQNGLENFICCKMPDENCKSHGLRSNKRSDQKLCIKQQSMDIIESENEF